MLNKLSFISFRLVYLNLFKEVKVGQITIQLSILTLVRTHSLDLCVAVEMQTMQITIYSFILLNEFQVMKIAGNVNGRLLSVID